MQKHQLIAFRRIAAKVYKKNLKWKKAVNMATKDGLFVDAMETASQSGSPELVKDLLSFFIEVPSLLLCCSFHLLLAENVSKCRCTALATFALRDWAYVHQQLHCGYPSI